MTLRYLIVPFRGRIYMFGDDEYVVNSSVVPHAKLLKQLNTLSFHHVHEAITSGVFVFTYIASEHNPADILSEHWRYATIWNMLKAIIFTKEDTITTVQNEDGCYMAWGMETL